MSKTKMTVGQAIVKFLNQQYIEMDGREEPFVDGIFTIFGHGMVVGLGQALEEDPGHLRVYQGRNEQGMAHAAISYAKQHNRAGSSLARPRSVSARQTWSPPP